MKKIALTLITIVISGLSSFGQSSDFIGTFVNDTHSISIQFKRVGDEYHGMLAAVGASFAIRATGSFNKINGELYGLDGPVGFEAVLDGTNMSVRATGYNEPFYKYSDLHNLGNFDLRPYMKDNSVIAGNNSGIRPSGPPPSQNNNTQYPELNNQGLFNVISGSQLVFYQRTSSVNDSMASSITYVNFCANGTFSMNTDGSFSVEGSFGGNAQGTSYGNNSGTWQLVSYQGQPAVYLQYHNGNTSLNPFNENEVRQGRWRRGNTQYALQRNKVRCN
ncbi:MAG: hypothetical protein VX798_12515 [Bacteroidota bacterium]|uniref:Uncharacterized protein n=1 Tax=Flagellimonas profundi TaxID=2915620 RepID=A0ABS3FCJ1_9FLAO|nr:hypothetical protein [Allomuricauda profundi]MBO0340827.1 hypothetical protein [Allomuricauda profundi]MEC7772003.1 hypothetical protein [Bacteroidota bacterium]